jgi:hypothetical protein
MIVTQATVTGIAQSQGRVTGVQLDGSRILHTKVAVNAAGPFVNVKKVTLIEKDQEIWKASVLFHFLTAGTFCSPRQLFVPHQRACLCRRGSQRRCHHHARLAAGGGLRPGTSAPQHGLYHHRPGRRFLHAPGREGQAVDRRRRAKV